MKEKQSGKCGSWWRRRRRRSRIHDLGSALIGLTNIPARTYVHFVEGKAITPAYSNNLFLLVPRPPTMKITMGLEGRRRRKKKESGGGRRNAEERSFGKVDVYSI